MGKILDKIGIATIGALLAFLLFYRLSTSITVAAISSILLGASLTMLFRLIGTREPKHLLGKRNFIRYLLLQGNGALKKAVEASFSGQCETEDAEGHTVLCGAERTLIYYTYKFGSLSEEDVAKSYRLAEKTNCSVIYALTNHLDRKAIAVAEYIPQRFTVIGAGTIYKYLLKKGLIPSKDALCRKKGTHLTLLKSLPNAQNAKYFIWAGLSTALLALFSPITTYYVVFSFLNLAIAILCVALSEKSEGKGGLFKE